MRTSQFYGGESAFARGEPSVADFAQQLPLRTIILVEEWLRSVTSGACTGIRDVAFCPSAYRPDLLAIAFFVVRDQFFVSPVLAEVSDKGKPVYFELLVLG